MKKVLFTAFVTATCLTVSGQTLRQSLYFDFGSITEAQGRPTEAADANGNHWNNITNNTSGNKYAAAGTVYADLVNSANATTGFSLTLVDKFSTNGRSGGGGLIEPSSEKIGDLAIATATEDYFFIEKNQNDCAFNISGLDAGKAYKFHIFASRKATDNRTGIYTLTGYNTAKGELQAAGKNLGGSGVNQNNRNVLVTDYVFPDANGVINLMISRKSGDYIPLNCMKMEEYADVEKPVVVKYERLGIAGTAAGEGVREMNKGKEHRFEVWTDLSAGSLSFTATTDGGQTVVFGMGDEAGTLVEGGQAIEAAAGPTRILADLDAKTYTITPVSSLSIIGSVTPGGWNLSSSIPMEYRGNMVYHFNGLLDGKDTNSDPARFNIVMNKSWSYTLKRVGRTDKISPEGTNDINLNPGVYDITVDLATGTFSVKNGNDALDPLRVTVMGSSVANGQGADPTGEGYAFQYGELLKDRFGSGESQNDFYISNISINGNSTVNLLERYDELQREFGRYVVYGVSLGNEGIHGASDQQAVYDQFATNMATLISKARADGKYPIVMNNYTRGDFEASDYEMVKRMDEEIEQWDCPSIDLLGAIDNGAGRWADGYMATNDIYHPNMAGHTEFMMAMVPSMMDAIASGKELTMKRTKGTSLTLDEGKTVCFTPEGTVHPFTLMFSFAAEADAHLANIATADGPLAIDLSASGVTATLPDGKTLAVAGTFTDGKWHTVFLSHHYAQGVVTLMVDASGRTQLEGVKIVPATVTIGNQANAHPLSIGELFFYRSGKTGSEALFDGENLHKSSLEIYVPLDDSKSEQENLAMSLNRVTVVGETSGIDDKVASVAPFEAVGHNGAIVVSTAVPTQVNICTPSGTLVVSVLVEGHRTIANLTPGLYLVNTTKVLVK